MTDEQIVEIAKQAGFIVITEEVLDFARRILAPKKEMTLVDRLRYFKGHVGMESICAQAADRIEELEGITKHLRVVNALTLTTDELLDELKRRMK